MFFYPYGQVSFSLSDVSCACVTQAIILIDDIGQQVHGSFAYKGEVPQYFEVFGYSFKNSVHS